MDTGTRTSGKLKLKIKERSDEIESLRIENELVKNEIIAVLRKNNRTDFIDKAEFLLELLLNTEQVIDVLRHDITEFVIAMHMDDFTQNQQLLLERILVIETDILKIGNLLKEVHISIDKHNASQ